MDSIVSIGGYIFAVIVALGIFGLVLSRLYTRASKERAFIRTGLGGQKVVLSGGAIVLPLFQEIMWVNMSTLNLTVKQEKSTSLTTKDRMRVDVSVDFYVRVASNADSVANAAQTLGKRTLNPAELKTLIEGKFVDALRSVATQMTMTDLQDQRADFVQRVQAAVTEDLKKNGLELESASLTRLEQTAKEFFDPNNVFDAEGLTSITRETEARRKLRNDIEQETKVLISKKDMETAEQQLAIGLKQEQATLANGQETARLRAEQKAEVSRTEAEGERASEQARIAAQQQIDATRIESERAIAEQEAKRKQAVESARIESERAIAEKEAARKQAVETARIASERAIAEAEADRSKSVETAQIAAKTAVNLASQNQAIEVANKSREESEARALAEEARAKSVVAEEQVETARVTERAEREKTVQVIAAQTAAEKESVGKIVAAEADQKAAQAHAEAQRIAASGEADAAKLRAEATVAEGQAVAAALRERNEAQNAMSQEVRDMLIKERTLEALPGMMAVMVRSIEKIDSIRIVEMGGMNGALGGAAGSGSLADQVGNAALRYRVMGPLMDQLMAEVGVNGQNPTALLESVAALGGVNGGAAPAAVVQAAAPAAGAKTKGSAAKASTAE